MKPLVAFIVAITFPAIGLAESVAIGIPGEAWRISFDSPPLSQKQEARRGADYAFKATSDRFNISLFVEQPQGTGTTHRDCADFYWSRASRNPMIAKDTVIISDEARYYRVQYDIVTDVRGASVLQRHVHYFVAFRGKWIDVHISIIQPSQEDAKILAAFDRSLRYGP